MLALSIRQPYAELILRGVKRIEYRSRATRIIGQRFWIYASKKKWPVADAQWPMATAKRIWSDELAVPGPTTGQPPTWLMELAEELILGKLPTGVLVGSAVIDKVKEIADFRLPIADGNAKSIYEWHLADIQRTAYPLKPSGHPQPVWFEPF